MIIRHGFADAAAIARREVMELDTDEPLEVFLREWSTSTLERWSAAALHLHESIGEELMKRG